MLKDKVVIITGASSGIGYATAKTLAKNGSKVAVGARRVDRLEKLQNEVNEHGGEILISNLDVTKKSDCDSFVSKVIEKWGQVDVIVNNACLLYTSDAADE